MRKVTVRRETLGTSVAVNPENKKNRDCLLWSNTDAGRIAQKRAYVELRQGSLQGPDNVSR